jgi:branched-subunit amino acid transport protein AzlD
MISVLALLTTVSGAMRYLPFLMARQMLKLKFLQKLSLTLPAVLSLLLVAHCVESTAFGIAEAFALSVVVAAQALFRNLVVSMLAGVCAHQILLYLL